MNPVLENLLNHRTIRRFTPDPVDRETLELIAQAGTRAATSGNMQPYTLVVIDDREKLAEWIPIPASAAIIALVDLYRIKRWFELSDAPFHLTKPSSYLVSNWDALIALHNCTVAAESLGLGTLYIGGILSEDMSEAIGAPEHTVPAGLVLLGHPAETPELRSRLPQEAVVHFGAYHMPSDDEVRKWYAETDAAFETKPEDVKEALKEKGIHNRGSSCRGASTRRICTTR